MRRRTYTGAPFPFLFSSKAFLGTSTSSNKQSSLSPGNIGGAVVTFGGVYPAEMLMLPTPSVNHFTAVEPHPGIAFGQMARREPSLTSRLVVGAVGGAKRSLPSGGAAYRTLEKL